jgi:hypothetical protein
VPGILFGNTTKPSYFSQQNSETSAQKRRSQKRKEHYECAQEENCRGSKSPAHRRLKNSETINGCGGWQAILWFKKLSSGREMPFELGRQEHANGMCLRAAHDGAMWKYNLFIEFFSQNEAFFLAFSHLVRGCIWCCNFWGVQSPIHVNIISNIL